MANILFCINDSCTQLLRTCLYSLKKSSGLDRLDVYIICSELKEENRKLIREMEDDKVSVSFINFDENCISSAPVFDRYPLEIYFRLFASELLPHSIGRILYLDVDIICINSLKELYNTDIDNYYFAGCSHTRKLLTKINSIRLGLDNNTADTYLNTGVLLMNIRLLRNVFSKEAVISCIEQKKGALILPDQDILMSLYGSRIKRLDYLKYNLSDRMFRLYNLTAGKKAMDIDDVRKQACLIHYCGRYKPWKKFYNGLLGIFYYETENELRQLDQD